MALLPLVPQLLSPPLLVDLLPAFLLPPRLRRIASFLRLHIFLLLRQNLWLPPHAKQRGQLCCFFFSGLTGGVLVTRSEWVRLDVVGVAGRVASPGTLRLDVDCAGSSSRLAELVCLDTVRFAGGS